MSWVSGEKGEMVHELGGEMGEVVDELGEW